MIAILDIPDHMKELGLLRKILLRIKSWMNFIFSDGH